MRQILLLLALPLILLAFICKEDSGISGTIKDVGGDPLIFASLKVYQKDLLVAETETDIEGLFSLVLPVGVYNIETFSTGYVTFKSEVVVKEATLTELAIVLDDSLNLMEEVIIGDSARESELTLKDIEALPTKKISAIAAKSAGVSVSNNGVVSIRGSRPESTVSYIDGIRVDVSKAAALVPQAQIAEISASEITAVESLHKVSKGVEKLPEAGHLTAGEWNDLKNWDTWTELVSSGEYLEMVDYWSLSEMTRHSVFVTNEANIPLANQKIELISVDGTVLWTAQSDNSGSAELWLPEGGQDYYIKAKGGKKVKPNKQAGDLDSYHLTLAEPCLTQPALDIMFVVDATSSMHDEINYIRAELSNVIERVKVEQQSVDAEVRLGTVFYKDIDDDYLTAVTPLDEDINKSIEFIRGKEVGGGGDNPEAVEAGLEEALGQDWNEAATNRLVFLILDAPPHHNERVMKKLTKQIKEAAEKGIKVIPVTASGVDRQTEYLMKQISILTNGTYVFLTNDSGIGNAHLEHIVPDYEVELFNDLLVRLITGYAKNYSCEKTAFAEEGPVQINVKAYPNPTSGQMTVSIDKAVDKILITSASGNRVMTVQNPDMETQVDLSQLIAGMYQLSIVVDGKLVDTQNVIKI